MNKIEKKKIPKSLKGTEGNGNIDEYFIDKLGLQCSALKRSIDRETIERKFLYKSLSEQLNLYDR